MAHLLTMPGSAKFYALHGWITTRTGAMEFRTAADALDYARTHKMVGALAERAPEPVAPGTSGSGAAAIFGYGARPRG